MMGFIEIETKRQVRELLKLCDKGPEVHITERDFNILIYEQTFFPKTKRCYHTEATDGSAVYIRERHFVYVYDSKRLRTKLLHKANKRWDKKFK